MDLPREETEDMVQFFKKNEVVHTYLILENCNMPSVLLTRASVLLTPSLPASVQEIQKYTSSRVIIDPRPSVFFLTIFFCPASLAVLPSKDGASFLAEGNSSFSFKF